MRAAGAAVGALETQGGPCSILDPDHFSKYKLTINNWGQLKACFIFFDRLCCDFRTSLHPTRSCSSICRHNVLHQRTTAPNSLRVGLYRRHLTLIDSSGFEATRKSMSSEGCGLKAFLFIARENRTKVVREDEKETELVHLQCGSTIYYSDC